MAKENQQDAPDAAAQQTGEDVAPEQAQILGEDELIDLSAAQASEAQVEPPQEDPMSVMRDEIASLKDQLLRSMAETENVRQRSRREREEGIKYAAVPLIRDLLGVCDNLQRAITAVPEEAAEQDEQLKNLLTGVQMTERELSSIFERHKIEMIDPLGEKLDPHAHEAMFEVPDPSQPSGTIVQVIQAGYRIHDRLIRPARVGIAKGGPAAATAEADAGAGAEDAEQGEDKAGSRVDTEA